MSSNSLEDIFREIAGVHFGTVATALLSREYKTVDDFAPFFPLLADELVDFASKVNNHVGATNSNFLITKSDVASAFAISYLIGTWCFGVLPQPIPTSVAPTPVLPPPTDPNATLEVKPDPNGNQACYVKGCGLKFTTFVEVIAHKVLVHGYNNPKYHIDWAKDVARKTMGQPQQGNPTASKPIEQAPVHASGSGTNMLTIWKPTLGLDLRDLGMLPGEASRFAAGPDGDARFYFVRLMNRAASIKGKFVWTKFRNNFTTVNVFKDTFIAKKMAGDTQEWIGLQSPEGVWMPDRTKHYECTYVGDHEGDLAEILKDPFEARVRYGKLIGACGYCGRKLTDPESRARGIGPDCWESKGIHDAYKRQAVSS